MLKEYLIKGYALNEKRLQEQEQQLIGLKDIVNLLRNVVDKQQLSSQEAIGLLKVVTDYTYALDILNKYGHQKLAIEGTTIDHQTFVATYDEAMNAINDLKEKFAGSGLFRKFLQ
ncbi:hypothetical protein [Pedobacter aquatilis]|uniref:hypothetical protein n=1 Tax=Pedobacter aquatilis TaxID=351343 RepID=UPI00292F190A|nr:hypothetical protein [Pedobacter aquatilis]